jgi:nucleoside-triphosphatase THEP1
MGRQGRRTAINAIDLLTGEEIPFAQLSRHRPFKGGERVGDYTINRDAILFACAAIERAVQNKCDLVVIDEVGPLELSGKGLMPAVELALASEVNMLIVVRSSLREALQRHFPGYDFMVIADLTQPLSDISGRVDCKGHRTAICESVPED